MLSTQQILVRKTRRCKTLEWKKGLDRRLRVQEAWDTGFHARDAARAILAYWSPFLTYCLSLISETIVQFSSQLSVGCAVAAVLGIAVQFSCLFGVLQSWCLPIANELSKEC
jgi:hypothetical protein